MGVVLTSEVVGLVTVVLSVKLVLFQHMINPPAVVASLKLVRLFPVSCPVSGKQTFPFSHLNYRSQMVSSKQSLRYVP